MTVQRTPRRAVDRRNRDADVINAAIEVFHAKGYSASSVQDVADVVGVLKGSLYHYISSKEDLLFRILDGSHQQALEIMEDVSRRGLPPRQRLETYLNELVHWYMSNIERVSLYFNEWRYLTGENSAAVKRQRKAFADYLQGILEEAGDELRPNVDARLATYFVLGAVNNLPDWYRKSGPYSAARVAQEFATMATLLALRD